MLQHQLRNEMRTLGSLFIRGSISNLEYIEKMNGLLDYDDAYRFYRRSANKRVRVFTRSTNTDKVVVRYTDGTAGTMLIKNVYRNLMVSQIDVWEDDDEDHEQDMLLQRLGIRV